MSDRASPNQVILAVWGDAHPKSDSTLTLGLTITITITITITLSLRLEFFLSRTRILTLILGGLGVPGPL